MRLPAPYTASIAEAMQLGATVRWANTIVRWTSNPRMARGSAN